MLQALSSYSGLVNLPYFGKLVKRSFRPLADLVVKTKAYTYHGDEGNYATEGFKSQEFFCVIV